MGSSFPVLSGFAGSSQKIPVEAVPCQQPGAVKANRIQETFFRRNFFPMSLCWEPVARPLPGFSDTSALLPPYAPSSFERVAAASPSLDLAKISTPGEARAERFKAYQTSAKSHMVFCVNTIGSIDRGGSSAGTTAGEVPSKSVEGRAAEKQT